MHPRLLELGPVTVYTYGVLLAAAYLAGLQMATARARSRGLEASRVMDLGIIIIIAAIVGAKLLLVAVDFNYYRGHPAEIFSLARSGGVFYGGLIAAVLAAFWYLRRHKMPVWVTCDVFAPGIALGHAIGRVGCLFAGCCFGRPTTLPWGIVFSDPFAASYVGTPLGVHLHPTQLYEAGAELAILALLLAVERRGRPFAGRTFWFYTLLYGVSRFVIEYFRGDERGMLLGLSTSQFISVVLVPLSVYMLLRLARRPQLAVQPAGATPPRPGRRHKPS
ncbi:MAG: lgt [Acidobacteria bacterium]|nr:lgt [Acidobacteriota bacterium]